jgi:hypothetical protein
VVYERSSLLTQNTSIFLIAEDFYGFTLSSSSQINLYFFIRTVVSIYMEVEHVQELLSELKIEYRK